MNMEKNCDSKSHWVARFVCLAFGSFLIHHGLGWQWFTRRAKCFFPRRGLSMMQICTSMKRLRALKRPLKSTIDATFVLLTQAERRWSPVVYDRALNRWEQLASRHNKTSLDVLQTVTSYTSYLALILEPLWDCFLARTFFLLASKLVCRFFLFASNIEMYF